MTTKLYAVPETYAGLTRSYDALLSARIHDHVAYQSGKAWAPAGPPSALDVRTVGAGLVLAAVAMPGPVGRRGFLKRLGVALAGGAVAAFAPAPVEAPLPPRVFPPEPAPRALTEAMMRDAMQKIMAYDHREPRYIFTNSRTIDLLRAEWLS
jgi:hypothetical protein